MLYQLDKFSQPACNGQSDALQQGCHVFTAEASFHCGSAKLFENNKTDLAGLIFFVVLHKGKPGINRKLWRSNGQSCGFQQADDAFGVGGFQVAFMLGKSRSKHHAGSYSFAVQPVAVAHLGFDGMAEGVAEVEQGPDALFFFVLLNDVRLHLAAVADGIGDSGLLVLHNTGHGLFEPSEKINVAEQGVFDDFGKPRGKFTRRKGLQSGSIGDDGLGLVKRADHVFAEGMVDASFSPHG